MRSDLKEGCAIFLLALTGGFVAWLIQSWVNQYG